jgi:adenylate cyclase
MWAKISDFIFGEAVEGELPARVQEQIRDRQNAGERLISWVQFIVIVLFGVLWYVSPKMGHEFQPVPWVLAGYFVFTLIRLWLAYRATLPTWFLTLSVLADMALLMVLIWSFHIQYEQPPSFYLKAPTLMYVFIFIALRALRFDAGYVVLSGATAIVGWSILMFFAIETDVEMTMVTRNYVEYMTSNAILIGAEVDKMVSIFLVTAVLTISVVRARRSVFRAVREQTAAEDLSRFVSKEVADHITSADRQIQPGDGEAREATVVFTDIEGFSTVSERMSAQELATTLNDYLVATGKIIERYGGVVTQFQGDLMLITYNAVVDDPDHALSAVRTAQEIEEICRNEIFNGETLKTRCGINTGEINVGAFGAQDRLAFTVHGDNVNIAARLEQLNKQHGTYIMMGEATYLAVRDEIPCELVCETPVRGREQPVKVYTPTS